MLLLLFLLSLMEMPYAQELTGPALLEKSIQYHDPSGLWGKQVVKLQLKESRPNGTFRTTKVSIDPKQGSFVLDQTRGEDHLWRKVIGDSCQHLLNNDKQFSKDDARKHRLTCEYSQMIRGYYEYLWGLPMKLKDEGTIIDPLVQTIEFQGEQLLSIRVTYLEAVGKDIWYFYFHPENYALRGYRFYHDERVNDGEYITIEGEELIGKIRYPKTRKWYVNKNDEYLGADELLKLP